MIDVIVIGAGWSGLTAGARLASSGWNVVVLEKSRGAGGRSATRRVDGFTFDHGAQYLTARSEAFSRQVSAWSSAGLLSAWRPELAMFGRRPNNAGRRPTERWIGVGGMNAVPKRLAEGLDCRWRWRAEKVEFEDGLWRVYSGDGQVLSARALLMTAPPAQTAALLGSEQTKVAQLKLVDMQPTWAVMVGYDKAPEVKFDAAFVNRGPLSWVARNDSKPDRRGGAAWTGHATTEWSIEHLERDPEEVARRLHDAMDELDPAFGATVTVCIAHRWRYAKSSTPLEAPILAEDAQRLVIAGDWCAGDRIEGAWVSGVAAARRLESLL